MASRDFPNDYFAWYNDEDRLAIVELDTTSTSDEKTKEKYDTFQGDGDKSYTITGVERSGTTATYTTSAVNTFAAGDRVSISGTTAYNDSDLASQSINSITVGNRSFTMTLSSGAGSTESGLSATVTSLFVEDGIRITCHAKYGTIDAITDDLKTDAGLDSGMHPMLVCYVKARLYEDQGDMQKAQYFRGMYEKSMKQYPLRKSGVRQLSVPKI